MLQDSGIISNLQLENNSLKQQINRLSQLCHNFEAKYQKALKEMSSIIQANSNLKHELDRLKMGFKNNVDMAIGEALKEQANRFNYVVQEKNELAFANGTLARQNQLFRRKIEEMEKSLWEVQGLKTELAALQKQKETYLLDSHPLIRGNANPEQIPREEKLSSLLEEFKQKVNNLNEEIDKKQQQNAQLRQQFSALSSKLNQGEKVSQSNHSRSFHNDDLEASKKQEHQNLNLRKKNVELVNEIEKLKLENLASKAGREREQSEINLLDSLQALHCQLEPLRYEVEELKRDSYYERESSQRDRVQLKMKLLSAQHEIQSLKKYTKQIEERNHELLAQVRQSKWEKNRIKEIEEEKKMLEGRVIVYEAMEMVARNRQHPAHVERIQQFERRIHLLLEEQNLPNLISNANVQQLIALKAYIEELDSKLHPLIEENKRLHKKYLQYKQKYQEVYSENQETVDRFSSVAERYKEKISGYEALILRMSDQLQKFIKYGKDDLQGEHPQTAGSVITLYETKIVQLYNEMAEKKNEYRQNLKKLDLQNIETRSKLTLMIKMEEELNELRNKNTELTGKLFAKEAELAANERGEGENHRHLLHERTKAIIQLEEEIQRLKSKIYNIQLEKDRDHEAQRERVKRLEEEILQLRKESLQTQRQSFSEKYYVEMEELVQKITRLEQTLHYYTVQQHLHETKREHSASKSSQPTISKEKHQEIVQENEYLKNQINRDREQNKAKMVAKTNALELEISKYRDDIYAIKEEKENSLLKMKQTIMELQYELSIKNKQLEIKTRQIERTNLELAKPHHSPELTNLHNENMQLNAELDRLKAKNHSIMMQSEDLVRKVQEMEEYISRLKGDFDGVLEQMRGLEKQLFQKQMIIKDWERKYRQAERNDSIQTFQSKVIDLEKTIRILENDKRAREDEIVSRQREFQRLQRNYLSREEDLKTRISELEIKLRNFEQRQRVFIQKEEELIRLQHQIKEKDSKYKISSNLGTIQAETLKKQYELSEQRLLQEKVKIKEQNNIIFELERKAKDSQLLAKKLQKEVTMKNSEIEALTSSGVSVNKNIVPELQLKIHQLDQELREKVSLLEVSHKKNQQMQKIAQQLKQKNELLKKKDQIIQEIEERIRVRADGDVEELQNLVMVRENSLKEVSDENTKLKGKIVELREIQRENAIEQQGTEQQILNFQTSFAELEQNHEKIVTDLKAQHDHHAQYLKNEIENLSQELHHLKDSLAYKNDAPIDHSNLHEECKMVESNLQAQIQKLLTIIQELQVSKKQQNPSNQIAEPSEEQTQNKKYQEYLQGLNAKHQEDIKILRIKLISELDNQRSIENFLTILVITFAEVDALRSRIQELEANFKKEHQNQINTFKHLDKLKQYDVNISEDLKILKELEQSHKAIHEDEERSRRRLIQQINIHTSHTREGIWAREDQANNRITNNILQTDRRTGVRGNSVQEYSYSAGKRIWDERSIHRSIHDEQSSSIFRSGRKPLMFPQNQFQGPAPMHHFDSRNPVFNYAPNLPQTMINPSSSFSVSRTPPKIMNPNQSSLHSVQLSQSRYAESKERRQPIF